MKLPICTLKSPKPVPVGVFYNNYILRRTSATISKVYKIYIKMHVEREREGEGRIKY